MLRDQWKWYLVVNVVGEILGAFSDEEAALNFVDENGGMLITVKEED